MVSASAANDLANIRTGYEGETSSAQGGYQQLDPKYRKAVNSEADYLRNDPYTDQYSTQVLGGATAGTNAAYNAAKANLAADMDVTAPDVLWVSDLTYIRLGHEFVYLAVVLDASAQRGARPGRHGRFPSARVSAHRRRARRRGGPP